MDRLTSLEINKITDLWNRNWNVDMICVVLSLRYKYVLSTVKLHCDLVGHTNPKRYW